MRARASGEPAVEGPRVRLRPLHAQDHRAWRAVRVRSRDWLEPWEPLPEPGGADPVTSAEAFRTRCLAWERQRHFDAAYGFGVFLSGGELVGEVSIGSVQRGPFQSAFIGYWIDRSHAGQGLIPEAVALVLQFGFEQLRLHRMEAAIVPRNRASLRVVEKLGLRPEGTARGFLQIRGVYEDHARFAMTAEEWEARRDEITAVFLT